MKASFVPRVGVALLVALAVSCDRSTSTETSETKPTEQSKGAEGEVASPAPVIPKPVQLDREPPTLTTIDDAARTRAKELTDLFDGRFSYETGNRHNALALLHLAHTATDVGLVTASLEAISRAYGPKQTDDDRAFDADYFAVVRQRLASDDPRIEEAAFEAAKAGMEAVPMDAELHAVLVSRAYHHPKLSGRLAALDALSKMKSPTKDVDDAIMHALDDESTALVALTLDLLGYPLGEKLPDQGRLEQRLTGFLTHSDPGVRAKAAQALADRTLYDDGERRRIAGLLAPLNDDPHPFVRLCALEARVEVDDPAVLPLLIERLDDQTATELSIEGWVQLDGSRDSETLYCSAGDDTASELAVWLLKRATRGEPHAFDPTPIDSQNPEASHKRTVDEAKAWATANAALLARG